MNCLGDCKNGGVSAGAGRRLRREIVGLRGVSGNDNPNFGGGGVCCRCGVGLGQGFIGGVSESWGRFNVGLGQRRVGRDGAGDRRWLNLGSGGGHTHQQGAVSRGQIDGGSLRLADNRDPNAVVIERGHLNRGHPHRWLGLNKAIARW